MTAGLEGDFVVFLIGMRINKPWKLHKWLPVAARDGADDRGCSSSAKDLGLLGLHIVVRPDRAADRAVLAQLRRPPAIRHGHALPHHPAVAGSTAGSGTDGDVGIWHETYPVRPGSTRASM